MASKKKMDYLSNTGGSSKQVPVKAKQAVEEEY